MTGLWMSRIPKVQTMVNIGIAKRLLILSRPGMLQMPSHMSITLTFSSDETINVVKEWLASSGIDSSRVKLSTSKNWVKLRATVKEAEALLKTEYYYFRHDRTGTPHIACDGYSLPAHVRKHIDIITPGVTMDSKLMRRSTDNLQKRGSSGLGVAFSNSPKLVPLANNITSLVSQLSMYPTCMLPCKYSSQHSHPARNKY